MRVEDYRKQEGLAFDPPSLAPGAAVPLNQPEIPDSSSDAGDIVITIIGAPVAKQRARTGKGLGFTPKKTKAYETLVKRACRRAMNGRPAITSLIDVEIDFLIEPSSSWPAWKIEAAMAGYVKPAGKSDIDNFVKSIFDGGNEVVWKDDRQIVSLQARQICCDESRAIVTVRQRETVTSAKEWKAIKNLKGL